MPIFRLLTLPTLAALLAAAPAPAGDDNTPEGVLKGKGLTVSNKVFVVESEQAVIDFVNSLKPAVDEMAQARAKYQEAEDVEEQFRYWNAELAETDRQIGDLNREIDNVTSQINTEPNRQKKAVMQQYRDNQLRPWLPQLQQYRALANSNVRKVGPIRVPPERIDHLKRVHENAHAQYLRQSAGLNEPYEAAKKQYDTLKADQTVRNALKEFNRQHKVSYQIGPSRELTDAIKAVEKVQKTYTPEVKARKVDSGKKPKRK
jgi:hypothetical protein